MKYLFIPFAIVAMTFTTSCNQSDAGGNNKSESSASTSPGSAMNNGLKVGYVDTDTLTDKLELLKELEEEFVAEKLMMENRLRAEVEKFEKDYRDAERDAPNLSPSELQTLESILARKEQELMMQKQNMEGQLMKSEQEKHDQVFDELRAYLDDYAKENGYHVIYAYSELGNLLYIDSTMDLTQEVIQAMNEKYQQSQATASE